MAKTCISPPMRCTSGPRELLPEISRATVYNTVQQFAEIGEVLELSLNGRSKHYDPNIHPAHHHLICDHCGLVYDVAHSIPAPALDESELHEMVIKRTEIVYHGTCAGCR